MAKRLKYLVDGEWLETESGVYYEITNSSTGEVMAEAPRCTTAEVDSAVAAAAAAFPAWRDTPVTQRVQVMFRLKALLEAELHDLAVLLSTEMGKTYGEARGDVLKAIEVVEVACGTPAAMLGDSLMNVADGYDTVTFREPMGVFVGIVPWNFPAMIPMGWMMPLAVTTGNTFVLKAASYVPQTAMRMAELLEEAGLPPGVFNLVTCSRHEAEQLLAHPDVQGVSFVGSTAVGRHIYSTAAANGKRVQALTEAKNHALVLRDAPIRATAERIVNSSFGCAGERCMALPVVVVEDEIADELVEAITELARQRKMGPAWDPSTELGPLVNADHYDFVSGWIDKSEVFGPVVYIKRVSGFEEGIEAINANEFANGASIFTLSGRHAREFARRVDAGMVGVNVGIPVPMSVFPFTGHKNSFFGDLHVMGRDGIMFFTETKAVTSYWFDDDALKGEKVGTWEGTMTRS